MIDIIECFNIPSVKSNTAYYRSISSVHGVIASTMLQGGESVLVPSLHGPHLKPCLWDRDGNGAGRGQRMGSSSPFRMVLSYPIPTPHDKENFLTSSLPFEAP